MLYKDQRVRHPRFGSGTVIVDQGETVVVRFGDEVEICEPNELHGLVGLPEAIQLGHWAPPQEVVLKAQAAAIRSLNDAWGVFSRSRISLLPHQLWVCHRALRQWPIRLMIADDVGLGKTVEAGLILWPLLARRQVVRLLILTPASLVEQWQYRLRTMFDIRLSLYRTEIDTDKSDFWNSHNQVVASLPTLRADRNDRHSRLLEAERWDMVIVDEAHHLNADDQTGKTLGFQLLEKLEANDRVDSCIFFSGTPHRGKWYGFWSLMKLLRPDLFDPAKPEHMQLGALREVMIRNLKQKVTDMEGTRLFKPVIQSPETYTYSDAETEFYNLLTRFITVGKAYASELDLSSRNQIQLVLIAMQKIASSSVAAIQSALRTRLNRLTNEASRLRKVHAELTQSENEAEAESAAVFEQWLNKAQFQLMENEIGHLEELLTAAESITEESKINRIITIIKERFHDRSVLLFTEYKATQALVISQLLAHFGEGSAGFINGDDKLDGVINTNGQEVTLTGSRDKAAEKFNQGKTRFLVSTEAGGEGIDLQENCYTLIHVDLPWNPMRLHQRVGRLNRYGQQHAVEVVTVRNLETVEARIWGKLEEKLKRIMLAFDHAMDEPEDLMQMVLGMAGPRFFDELFDEGQRIESERFNDWFDDKTCSLGGQSAIDTVTELVGHCQSFDLSQLEDVPKKDLPDLVPFFQGMLTVNHRRPDRNSDIFSFKTPQEWLNEPGIRTRYEGLIFNRDTGHNDAAKDIVGVGHKVFDQALNQASEWDACLALSSGLTSPLALFLCRDALTSQTGHIRECLLGITGTGDLRLVLDEEILSLLNTLKQKTIDEPEHRELSASTVTTWLNSARSHADRSIAHLPLPFRKPMLQDLLLLWPSECS